VGLTIARNTLLNLAGHAAPLLAAIGLVPPLVERLGAERFGFLAIAWVLVGYFSLLDFGLGRTLSKLVAERAGTVREAELPAASRTALALTLMFGVAAGVVLLVLAEPVCTRVLSLSPALTGDAVAALRILALCLPLVTLTAALRGLLEAGGRFDWVNVIRVPLGVLTFAAPLAATAWSDSLVALALALAAVRVAAFVAHWAVCARFYPALTALGWPQGAAAREMLQYGAWMTVSNVVGPLMVSLDRFVIGAVLAVSAVAYYTPPYEIVTRVWLIPAAITSVLFPAMAAAAGRDRLADLYRKGIAAVMIAVVPLTALLAVFAFQWLDAWLGPEFAEKGVRVAQLLCAGTAVNCAAYLPFTLLQARGRADLTAKAHVAELPFYLLLLALLVRAWGIEGAALAWAARSAVDAAVLFWLAHRHLGRIA
jgi:O-antigen/teichoic acid export membrane protein